MRVVLVCEALGITYDEYMNSPSWWIDLRVGKKGVETEYASKLRKK